MEIGVWVLSCPLAPQGERVGVRGGGRIGTKLLHIIPAGKLGFEHVSVGGVAVAVHAGDHS